MQVDITDREANFFFHDPDALMVKDVMTTDVFTLYEEDYFVTTNKLMKWKNIRHIPIIDNNGILVGLITNRDILKLSAIHHNKLDSVAVEAIMQKSVAVIAPEASLQNAAQIMFKKKFGCLPVVTSSGKLVGIITEADFVKFFLEWEVEKKQLRSN